MRLDAKIIIAAIVIAASCGGSVHRHRATKGAVLGIARDLDSGDPVAFATILLRKQGDPLSATRKSSDRGLYQFLQLEPGLYNVSGSFAGQTVDVSNVPVLAGESIPVDITFTLGHPDAIHIDYGNAKDGSITRFRPKQLKPGVAKIQGTLTDNRTRGRIVGAAISLINQREITDTKQVVTDEFGTFQFDDVPPGIYALSSYYSVQGRQIELRRSEISVQAGDGVFVPLWVEVSADP
jgi:hypothetical protein